MLELAFLMGVSDTPATVSPKFVAKFPPFEQGFSQVRADGAYGFGNKSSVPSPRAWPMRYRIRPLPR